MKKKQLFLFLFTCLNLPLLFGQHEDHHSTGNSIVGSVEPQPLLAQAIRLKEALSFLGSSLSQGDEKRLMDLQRHPITSETTKAIQDILDPYCLAMITINPESRVHVTRGPASAKLNQSGWSTFLVKVNN